MSAFDDAGLEKLIPKYVVAFGFQKGSVAAVKGSGDPCEGTSPYERTLVFHPNGYLLDYRNSKLASDCRCYQLVDDDTFVVLGDPGYPDMPTEFQIEGETLTFNAVRPDPCSTVKCLDQFAFTVAWLTLSPWHRVA